MLRLLSAQPTSLTNPCLATSSRSVPESWSLRSSSRISCAGRRRSKGRGVRAHSSVRAKSRGNTSVLQYPPCAQVPRGTRQGRNAEDQTEKIQHWMHSSKSRTSQSSLHVPKSELNNLLPLWHFPLVNGTIKFWVNAPTTFIAVDIKIFTYRVRRGLARRVGRLERHGF